VSLGGNSHNHSLARQASLLNHAALGPFIPLLAVLAKVALHGQQAPHWAAPPATSRTRHTYLTWLLEAHR